MNKTCLLYTSPFSPFRFWRKNSGPGMVNPVTIATTIRITGKSVQRHTDETTMLSLIHIYPIHTMDEEGNPHVLAYTCLVLL